jgi:hypothetical protein
MSYVSPNVQPSGTTFSQFRAGGTSGQLERLIAANSGGTSNPTSSATISATGGGTVGGSLASGSYYLTFAESNGFGETLAAPESPPFSVVSQVPPSAAPQIVAAGGGTTGGKLASGTYYAKYTWVDSNNGGETTASPESTQFSVATGSIPQITLSSLPAWASGANIYLTVANALSGSEILYASAVTSSTYALSSARPLAPTSAPPATNGTSTSIPVVTFPALQPGNIARNIYLTLPGSVSGTEQLYIRGVTTATYSLGLTAPGPNVAVSTPRTNSTAWATRTYEMVRSVKDGNLDSVYRHLRQTIYDYNRGTPSAQIDVLSELARTHSVFALLAQLCTEVGTLIEANPGHINSRTTGIGTSALLRSWP